MNESRRDARLCLAGAALCTATSIWFAIDYSWWALPCAYVAVFLGVCQRRLVADYRRGLARREEARRAAVLGEVSVAAPPAPCCSFWRHSEGKVHGPGCTRPPLPRREKGSAA
jgi:hypothetical protein